MLDKDGEELGTSVAHQSLRVVPEILQGHKAIYNQVSKRPPRRRIGWGDTAALHVFWGDRRMTSCCLPWLHDCLHLVVPRLVVSMFYDVDW